MSCLAQSVPLPVRSGRTEDMDVYIIVAQGNSAQTGSLLERAGLEIEAVFTDRDEAERYRSMGDMEIETRTLNAVE
jgi:hypothetical protein